jgi:VanZ family protein
MFIVYGSFIPFRFSADAAFVQSQWAHFFSPPVVDGTKQFSIADVISNVLLFVPFGFFWLGSEIRKRIFSRLFGASFGLGCLGLLFGLTIELGQTFSPGRTASVLDALCNALGSGIGGIVGYFVFRAGRGAWGRIARGIIRERPSLMLLGLLVLVSVADAYYPFDITIDVSTVWDNFKHIHWLPFVGAPHRFWADLVLEKGFLFAAGGYLIALNLRRIATAVPRALSWCLCVIFAAGLEAGKLFFAARVPNPENLIVCTAGALLGTYIIVPLSETVFVRRHSTSILITLMVALEAYSELSPFDWVSSVGELRTRLATVEWLPFAAYYGAAPQSALFDFGKKLLLAGPLGFIIASGAKRGRLLAAMIGLLSGVTLEACQVALRSRTASITDVLLFGGAAWVGASIFERISGIRSPEKEGTCMAQPSL